MIFITKEPESALRRYLDTTALIAFGRLKDIEGHSSVPEGSLLNEIN
jgi:hypothetical protein